MCFIWLLCTVCDPEFIALRQRFLLTATFSQLLMLMPPCFMSRLHTSMKRRQGRPTEREPVASWPKRRSFGRRKLSILLMWPSHRRRFLERMAWMDGIPDLACTSSFVTRSLQDMPRMRLKERRWNALSLFSWDV